MTEDGELLKILSETRLCTPWGPECGRGALWLLTKSCCGLELPLCTYHKEKALSEAVRLNVDLEGVACYACRGTYPEITVQWRSLK